MGGPTSLALPTSQAHLSARHHISWRPDPVVLLAFDDGPHVRVADSLYLVRQAWCAGERPLHQVEGSSSVMVDSPSGGGTLGASGTVEVTSTGARVAIQASSGVSVEATTSVEELMCGRLYVHFSLRRLEGMFLPLSLTGIHQKA